MAAASDGPSVEAAVADPYRSHEGSDGFQTLGDQPGSGRRTSSHRATQDRNSALQLLVNLV